MKSSSLLHAVLFVECTIWVDGTVDGSNEPPVELNQIFFVCCFDQVVKILLCARRIFVYSEKFVPKEVVLDLIIANLQVTRAPDFSIIFSSTRCLS
jgi:hypothetical protein